MSQLVDFLTNLAVNPLKQGLFALEAPEVLAQSGLSMVEQRALLSRDSSYTADLVVASMSEKMKVAVADHRYLVDPGPDPDTDPTPWPEISVK